MLLFCPACSNMLTIVKVPPPEPDEDPDPDEGTHRFECRTCPYQHRIDSAYFERKRFAKKKVEDIIGGDKQWENVDKTEVTCPNEKCSSQQAFFFQVQIRSADEPMTSFFRCVKCFREWRE